MITIDDVKYEKEDLNETQISQVERIDFLRKELGKLQMQANELNVIISAYANAIKEGSTEEE